MGIIFGMAKGKAKIFCPFSDIFLFLQVEEKKLPSFPLIQVVKHACKVFTDEVSHLLLQHLYGEVPGVAEPRFALARLTQLVFIAVSGVQEREVSTVAMIVSFIKEKRVTF